MARIRSIKPEFWTDEKVVELTYPARLLFIGLWNFADEHGRCDGSPKRIKMQVFPADNLDVENLLIEILQVGLISDYSVNSKKYIQINNFDKHQKVNKHTKSRYPDPPDEKLADSSDKKSLVLELEQEQEQKPSAKKSDKSDQIEKPKPEYRWQGETIKLTPDDYEKFKSQYPNLDLDEQLAQLDLELRGKKDWFMALNAKLNYRNKTPTHQARVPTAGEGLML